MRRATSGAKNHGLGAGDLRRSLPARVIRLSPLTRYAVNTCEFDEHAKLVMAPEMRRRVQRAGFDAVDVRYRIFFPHVLRRLRGLERKMTWLPLGAQYYIVGRKAS